jgi:hypothetical protein
LYSSSFITDFIEYNFTYFEQGHLKYVYPELIFNLFRIKIYFFHKKSFKARRMVYPNTTFHLVTKV